MLRAIADFAAQMSATIAAFFEREAGYQMMSASLIMFGVWIADTKARVEMSHDLLVFGLGVMARSMGGSKKPIEPLPPGSTRVEAKETVSVGPSA